MTSLPLSFIYHLCGDGFAQKFPFAMCGYMAYDKASKKIYNLYKIDERRDRYAEKLLLCSMLLIQCVGNDATALVVSKQ
jgi:hypothetical protein